MKKHKIKEKVDELKVVLLSLNAYGALDLKTHSIIKNHIDSLFKFKKGNNHE